MDGVSPGDFVFSGCRLQSGQGSSTQGSRRRSESTGEDRPSVFAYSHLCSAISAFCGRGLVNAEGGRPGKPGQPRFVAALCSLSFRGVFKNPRACAGLSFRRRRHTALSARPKSGAPTEKSTVCCWCPAAPLGTGPVRPCRSREAGTATASALQQSDGRFLGPATSGVKAGCGVAGPRNDSAGRSARMRSVGFLNTLSEALLNLTSITEQ